MAKKKDHEYGIGERADGTIDVFPASEWPARRAELRAMIEGETEPDDLGDLGDVEKLFDAPDGKITQAEAEYVEPWADVATQCLGCAMFREPDACSLVDGVISPEGHCKHFEPDDDEER